MASAYLRSFTDRMYNALNVTAGGTVAKNDLAVIENQVGFYMEDAVLGDEVAFVVECQKAVFPKSVAAAMAVGDDVYYDDVNENVCLNNAFRSVGYCIKAALITDTTVWIRFHQEAAGSTY